MSGSYTREEDAQEEEEDFGSQIDNVVFLVDARGSMYEECENEAQDLRILNILQVALELMKAVVIESPRDSIGIIFFGTQKKEPVETGDDNGK